jgi:hypothetical protein
MFLFSCYIERMTLQQTVTIPADRRLHLDLPRDTPTGEAEVKLVITPKRAPRNAAEDARYFRESLTELCLNRSTFENPSTEPLEPLLGMAEGSSFTVERLLQDRRAEEKREAWTTPSTPVL